MKPGLFISITSLFVHFSVASTAQDTLAPQVIREVVVTGQFSPTDSRNTVLPVRVLTRERIDRLGANNLEQLLRQELNLRINQDMVLGSSISIQGLAGQNVKIMIDGIPVVGRTNGNVDLGQINLANIERVEIIEGPASVFYGTDALAGVINLISKRGQAEKWKIGLGAQYEQLGERSLMADAGVQIGEKLLLMASGGYDQFEGFDTSTNARNLLWNPKKQSYANASLRYLVGKDNFIRFKAGFFDENIKNAGDIRRPQFKPYAFDDTYRTIRKDITLLHEGTVFKKFYWNNAFGVNTFLREKESLRTEIETNEQNPVTGEQDTSRFASTTLRSVLASKNNTSRWQWLAGFDIRHDRAFGQRIRDSISSKPGESAMTDAALIGSLRYRPFKSTIIESGLRAGRNNRYGNFFVPSLHVKQRLTDQAEASASYARGFRSPDLKELFFYFVDASHYIIGNPNLQPEQSNNIQANLRWDIRQATTRNSTGLQVSMNGFWNSITDKIELYEFIETNNGIQPAAGDTSTLRYAYFNIDRFKTHGLNVRGNTTFRDFRFDLGGNITGHFNPYSTEDEATPEFTYTHELNAALQWQHSTWNAGVWFRTNDRFIRYYPETINNKPVITQRTISGYSNIDIAAGKTFLHKRLTIQAGIRNLLNIQSAAVTGGGGGTSHSGNDSVISPGRSWWVTVKVAVF